MNAKSQNRSGYQLEKDVGALIKRLEHIGFARDIRLQDHVKDRDGNTRKVDISFVLVTWAVEILVSVECKSKSRPVSLDDVDQLKTFKSELPERNIFWLVYEGSINASVKYALKTHGISAYSRDDLAVIIDHMIEKCAESSIESVREKTHQLSMMHPGMYGMSAANLKEIELGIISDFSEAVALLRDCDHYYSQPYYR